MDEFFSVVAFFFVVTVIILSWLFYRMKRRANELERRLAALTSRVYLLEHPVVEQSLAVADAADAEEPASVVAVPSAPPHRSPEEWEAVVGGSWLNRIGALILVVGIALFLGYSLTHLGPAGKVAIGFAVGFAMLAAGVSLRSSERYGNFSISLVGGGWSAIYFTAYAAHALEPARIIDSATLGAILLLAVSAAMVLHALSYQSEPGTALAFLFSFVSLNVSPLTGFSVYAAVLMAMSMLTLAHLRNWFRLAVTGVVLAYATFLLRGDAPRDLAPFALWIQWFAFEAFDILDIRNRGLNRGIERSIFLLNACGFIGASLIYRWNDIGWFLFVSALAYLASALIRAYLTAGETDPRARVFAGGYEGAIATSSLLMAGALIDRFSGTTMTLALLIEGEMIVLAGHALKNSFLRAVGGFVCGASFFRLLCLDAPGASNERSWTPLALVMAGVFSANRLRGGWAYAAGAGTLLTMVIKAELPRDWVPFALGAIGVVTLWVAVRLEMDDVRAQHLFWALLTFMFGCVAVSYPSSSTLPLVLAVVTLYCCEFLVRNEPNRGRLERYVAPFYSILGTLLLTILLFDKVQGRLLTVALGVQGAGLLSLGMFSSERILRLSGLALFLLCIGKAFLHDLRQLDTLSRILSFIVLGLLLLGASWVYTRFRERINRLL